MFPEGQRSRDDPRSPGTAGSRNKAGTTEVPKGTEGVDSVSSVEQGAQCVDRRPAGGGAVAAVVVVVTAALVDA